MLNILTECEAAEGVDEFSNIVCYDIILVIWHEQLGLCLGGRGEGDEMLLCRYLFTEATFMLVVSISGNASETYFRYDVCGPQNGVAMTAVSVWAFGADCGCRAADWKKS